MITLHKDKLYVNACDTKNGQVYRKIGLDCIFIRCNPDIYCDHMTSFMMIKKNALDKNEYVVSCMKFSNNVKLYESDDIVNFSNETKMP